MAGALLAILLVYTVNQLHLPQELGIRGLNVANLLFAIAALAVVAGGGSGATTRPLLKRALLGWFAMLVVAFAIARARGGGELMADLTYLKTALFYPLFYFLFFHGVRDLKWTRWLIGLTLLVAFVAGLEALKEAVGYGIGQFVDSRRASGPFGIDYRSANRAGVYYAMFLPLFLGLAVFLRRQPLLRAAAFAGVLVVTGAILFTYSRQAYFIALIGLVLLLARRGVLATLLGLAVVWAVVPHLPEGVGERVEETQQQGDYGQVEYDASTASRWEIWSGAVSMWAEHPLGIGLNRFQQNIGEYSTIEGKDAHNFYVLTLAEAGIQGLVALLVLLAAMWRLVRRLRAAAFDAEGRALAVGANVAFVCMMLGNVYGSPFFEGAVMGTFWALLGLLERYALLRQPQRAAAAREPAPAGVPQRAPVLSPQ
ncbi:MAG TPA: O-antigen ligase family protein [Xanthomonadales bacterium]|nr:O-antigen ligase family protein [Xanthomonadales bacterium]